MMSTMLAEAPTHVRKEVLPSHVAAQPMCWCVTDGSAGTVAQVKALAAALGYTPAMKTVKIAAPFIWLPNTAYDSALQYALPKAMHTYDALEAPWPELIISCGRRGALAALGIKHMLTRKTKEHKVKLVHIHDPQMSAKHFNLIIAMQHDAIEGKNVIKTPFALHQINDHALSAAKERFTRRFSLYTTPFTAVLLGGGTNKYNLNTSRMAELIGSLRRVMDANPGSLLVTPSRRTGHDNIKALVNAFPRMRDSRVYVYDGISENPYLGILALSDHIIVTNDSVNMMSEAVATGKPVHILRLPGHINTKPARFAEKLISEGFARPLEGGKLESWQYTAGDEMQVLSEQIKRQLAT
jgi:mitochondrial fission protein ELM1